MATSPESVNPRSRAGGRRPTSVPAPTRVSVATRRRTRTGGPTASARRTPRQRPRRASPRPPESRPAARSGPPPRPRARCSTSRRTSRGPTGPRPASRIGPPSRTADEAPATAAPAAEPDSQPAPPPAPPPAGGAGTSIFETAGTAKPEAATPATGTPTDETPAAVSTGVESPESDRAGQSPPGTETEMLVPGSGPAPVAAPGEPSALLGSIDAGAVRARFLDIQAGFVDEPRQAVQEAERFVDELVQGLVRALETERAKLKATIEEGSTEDLRIAVRGYRAFVDRLLNLSM